MDQLIAAAFEHAKQLRQGANAAEDYGARHGRLPAWTDVLHRLVQFQLLGIFNRQPLSR
jgi:hypothetical protein